VFPVIYLRVRKVKSETVEVNRPALHSWIYCFDFLAVITFKLVETANNVSLHDVILALLSI